MNELRLRAVREPDAPPEDKVAAVCGWAQQGSDASQRSAWGTHEGIV